MAKNEADDSKFVKGMFLGLLLGVLSALAVGGSLAYLSVRQERQHAEVELREARRETEIARKEAERQAQIAKEKAELAHVRLQLFLDMQNKAAAADLAARTLSDQLKDAKQQDR